MNDNRLNLLRDISVFVLLIAIGVVGRWAQPEWAFTPTAATAVFAGLYFARWPIACLVPLSVLVISDLLLPAYDSVPVMLVTYALMMLPVLFGRLLRGEATGWSAMWRWGVCGLVPATLFFVVTNFAVWAFQSDYAKTLAGLVECYARAVPFYRWMLAGDVFYLGVIGLCWLLAGMPGRVRSRVAEPIASNRGN